MNKVVMLSVLGIAVLGIVFVSIQDDSDEQIIAPKLNQTLSAEQNSVAESDHSRPSVLSDDVLPYKSRVGNLPSSLRGTIMDQKLAVDEQGHIRVSSDIQRVFDYFLSVIEEEELETILARINEYLDYQLNEPALSESKEILGQYIALKQSLFEFEEERSEMIRSLVESGQLAQDKGLYLKLLQEQLEAKTRLREEHLNPDVHEAFYADEEAYDQYTLSRMLVESNSELSQEEKQQRLAEIDANAPQDIVESRKESQLTDTLKAKTLAMKKSGASQEDIHAMRTEMLGVEAADRFSKLDQERAQWKTRLDDYLSQRKVILNEEGLSMEERQQQVDNLRGNLFDSREQIRVKVYERKADA